MAYYFNLPTDNDLTGTQRSAINDTQAIALSGGPGTGKSVVLVYRHINNYKLNIRKSVLLTYTKSLQFYLEQSVRSEIKNERDEIKRTRINVAGQNIHKTWSWDGNRYEEIIIDEAQDLPENVNGDTKRGCLNYINKFSARISYCADDNQILYPDKSTNERRLRNIFPNSRLRELDENFRNTYEILKFTQAFFSSFKIENETLNMLRDNRRNGSKPVLKIVQSEESQIEAMYEIFEDYLTDNDTHNIVVLAPLQDQVKSFYNRISSRYPKTSYYISDSEGSINFENIHVTTFKSVKGLEFDTVIIPNFHKYHDNIRNLNVVNEQDYYVAITRAKRNLFLLSNVEMNGEWLSTVSIENSKHNKISNYREEEYIPQKEDDLPF